MSSDSQVSGDEERRALENDLNDRTRSRSPSLENVPQNSNNEQHEQQHEQQQQQQQQHQQQQQLQQQQYQTRDQEGQAESGSVLYVSGLARAMQDSDLRELFGVYGTLTRAQVVVDPHTKDNRGFGFVSFKEEPAIEAAINALHGKEHLGRVLGVERAKRARPRSPTPGRYYGPNRDREPRRYPPRQQSRYDNNGGGGRRGPPRRSRSQSRGRYDHAPMSNSNGGGGGGYEYRGDRYAPPPHGHSSRPSYYTDRERDYGRSYDNSRSSSSYDNRMSGAPLPPYYPPPPQATSSRDHYSSSGNAGSRYDNYSQSSMYMPPPPIEYNERRYPPPAVPMGLPPRPRSPYRS